MNDITAPYMSYRIDHERVYAIELTGPVIGYLAYKADKTNIKQ